MMTRREALHGIAALLGGAISAPLVTGVLSGCRAGAPTENWTPRTLTSRQDALVAEIAERIIPETDTPGARAAGVNEFVDKMLTDWYPEEGRTRFLQGLDDLEARMQERYGVAFLDATPEQQDEMLQTLDAEGIAAREAGEEALPFFAMMKELTLVGYYTSEIGMTQELQWLPTPGRYDGCVPVDQVGRAWA